MRLSWRKHLTGRLGKSSSFYSLGLVFNADTLTASVLQLSAGELVWVAQHSLPLNDWQPALARWVKQQKLQNTDCHVVFDINWYNLLQVDKPQVPDSELKDALQWPVKELLPEQGELVLDYFDLPSQTTGSNKVNVVALSKEQIVTIVTGCIDAGLQLQSIGIAELATCNLLATQADSDQGVITLFQQAGQEMCLNIVKNGNLYFSRRLKGYENLGEFSAEELQMGIIDTLSVQIQRSMDYFESQLRQAPVQKILLCVDSQHKQALAQQIEKMTSIDVAIFSTNIELAAGLPASTADYIALGAALSKQQQKQADQPGQVR